MNSSSWKVLSQVNNVCRIENERILKQLMSGQASTAPERHGTAYQEKVKTPVYNRREYPHATSGIFVEFIDQRQVPLDIQQTEA
ncbi:hypothetical protein ON010_g11099 [Phytophthora cinnamomi]|nr:hypothetical protein ON010_g11099 [Phytophthora cinnamomi]